MKSSGATKVERVIEASAVALGFSRRVSYARVERELARYCPSRHGREDLDCGADRPRFLAVASLFLLMDAARNLDREIATLRRELAERMARTRLAVAKVAA